MNPVLLILDVYIVLQLVWLFLVETDKAKNNPLTPYLSRICSPFCRLFYQVELIIRGRNFERFVPLITLILVRFVLSAL